MQNPEMVNMNLPEPYDVASFDNEEARRTFRKFGWRFVVILTGVILGIVWVICS